MTEWDKLDAALRSRAAEAPAPIRPSASAPQGAGSTTVADFAALPEAVRQLITRGTVNGAAVEVGHRSTRFAGVLKDLKRLHHWSLEDATAILAQHPAGIAAKYLSDGRDFAAHVKKEWDKIGPIFDAVPPGGDAAPQPPAGETGKWTPEKVLATYGADRLLAWWKRATFGGQRSDQETLDAIYGGYHPWATMPGLSSIAHRAADDDTRAKWVIEQILPARATGSTAGAKSSAKTPLEISKALAIALGDKFWAHPDFIIERAAPVLYLAVEDAEGVLERTDAALIARKLTRKDVPLFYINETRINMTDQEKALIELTKLCGRIKFETGIYPAAIWIDTKSKATPGAREMNEDMSAYVSLVEGFALQIGTTITTVHHMPKAARLPNAKPGARTSRGGGSFSDDQNFSMLVEQVAPLTFEWEVEYMKGGSRRGWTQKFLGVVQHLRDRPRADGTVERIESVSLDFATYEPVAPSAAASKPASFQRVKPVELKGDAQDCMIALKEMCAASADGTTTITELKAKLKANYPGEPARDAGKAADRVGRRGCDKLVELGHVENKDGRLKLVGLYALGPPLSL